MMSPPHRRAAEEAATISRPRKVILILTKNRLSGNRLNKIIKFLLRNNITAENLHGLIPDISS